MPISLAEHLQKLQTEKELLLAKSVSFETVNRIVDGLDKRILSSKTDSIYKCYFDSWHYCLNSNDGDAGLRELLESSTKLRDHIQKLYEEKGWSVEIVCEYNSVTINLSRPEPNTKDNVVPIKKGFFRRLFCL